MGSHTRRALEIARAELGGAATSKRYVCGRLGGVAIEFSVESSGWRVDAKITEGPYALDVLPRRRPHDVDDPAHLTGDEAFDDAFTVTGAPKQFLAQAFEPRILRRLRYLRPRHVQVADGKISIVKRYSYFCAEPEEIRAALDIAANIAVNIEGYLRDVQRDALNEGHRVRSPYRGAPDRRKLSMALARRYLPVSRYLDRRHRTEIEKRKRTRNAVGMLVAWGFLMFLVNAI